MSFAIEVPAAANPLTPQTLLHGLQSAVTPSHAQLQTGAQQLQRWESERGYYSLLQEVYIDQSLPYEIRYVAVIQLKNGIDKYWRKTATNAVTKEEKLKIRSRLLESGINEPDQRLALQNALVVSKIIRFEYPNDWPDAVTSILVILRSATQPGSNPLHLPRILLILLQVVKELSTARLQRSRASLQSITPEIVYVLGRVYIDRVQRWRSSLTGAGEGGGATVADLEMSLLLMKILRRLIISGYEHPNRAKDVQEFWVVVRIQFGDFIRAVHEDLSGVPGAQRLIEKLLIQLAKFHVEMAKVHPASFALLPESVPLTREYWTLVTQLGQNFGSKTAVVGNNIQSDGDAADEKPLLERLSLQGLLLLRSCVKMVYNPTKSFKYRTPEDKEEQKQSTDNLKAELLTPVLAHEIMEIIVTRFFVFRESDLREWEEEPDEWEAREEGGGDAWEYSVRGSSEKLFLDLIIHFKDSLLQPLMNVFNTVSTPDSGDVLFKDSIYTAVGLAASVLNDSLDFDAFLTSTLVIEVQKQKPGYNVLRRRIAILIGEWITVRISNAGRAVAYEIFRHLLDKEDSLNDQVVRITAARQFKTVADEWEFNVEAFLPHASEILTRLMALIEEIELTETKMALVATVSVIVERLEHRISPFAERIVSLLPPLWEQSGEEQLMKQVILTVFTRLIYAMKVESLQYHSMVLPLIHRAVEPGSELQLYLLDDALDLWAAILSQTAAPAPPELLALAPQLFSIFELGSDSLRKSLEITESYILLAPTEMLQDDMRTRLLTSFAALLRTIKQADSGVVTHLVENLIRTAEGLGGEAAVEVVAAGLIQSGFLKAMIDGLMENWKAQQTTGPNRRYPPLDGVVETDYLSVLARIALASPTTFVKTVGAVATPEGNQFEHLLDEWFSHFGNIGAPSQRKLNCLALTRLLETGDKWILSRMQDLMTVWTDVVEELQEGQYEKGVDLVYTEEIKPTVIEAPEDERKRQFEYSDPIHRVNAMQYIKHHLVQAMARCGGQDAFQRDWLDNVDANIIRSFGNLELL